MEKYKKEVSQCPVCGSTKRLFESLGNKVKEAGLAQEGFTCCMDFKQGVIIDKRIQIPIGSEIPAYRVMVDVCLDCHTIYAVLVEVGSAKKVIKPIIPFQPISTS